MLNPETRVIVSGSIAIDNITVLSIPLIQQIREYVHPTVSISTLIDDEQVFELRGGTGANIAYTLALLGENPILLAATSKKDEEYLQQLSAAGVDVSYVHRSHRPTARFSVTTDSLNNQIATFLRGAMADASSLTLLPWRNQQVFVIISPHDPAQMAAQVEECVNHHLPYCYDIGQQISNTNPADLLRGVQNTSMLVANEYEMLRLSELTGVTQAEFRATLPLYITTHGKDGAVIEGTLAPEPIHIPAASVERVVDPTGAGDAWRAGFLAGLRRGKNLIEAGGMGAVSAAFVVEQKGGQEHRFSQAEFADRLTAYEAQVLKPV